MSQSDKKAALLVAFHFPPLGESSGLQRTLSLANDLAELGWQPVVLTVTPGAYRRIRDDQVGDIDPRVKVIRAFAVDASRVLAFRGKYPRAVALPDVWSSWIIPGFFAGLYAIVRYRPSFLWSTYPIATAHLLGLALTGVARLPWIADFRDSMTEKDYPTDSKQRRVYQWIERAVVNAARRCVFTANGTLRMYRERYPDARGRFTLIANGYEERYFRDLQSWRSPSDASKPLTLLHSGIVYPYERDPSHLFEALRLLKEEGIGATRLRIVFRASGHDATFRPMVEGAGLSDIVQFAPPIGYREALAEMIAVDAVLVLQAANSNHQVPAKVYEYIRSGTPILALVDPAGDTAQLMREIGNNWLSPLDDAEAIHRMLRSFLEAPDGARSPPRNVDVTSFSRKVHARMLERLAVSGSGP